MRFNARTGFILCALAAFSSLSGESTLADGVNPSENAVISPISDATLRKEMAEAARGEMDSLLSVEVSPDDLGEWREIVESSLFLLLRRTELYRGQARLLVTDDPSIFARLYPDGTFALSTALLDYIDATLFSAASDSPRRIRNIDNERETMLLPFLAVEAARFALDQPFSAFRRSLETTADINAAYASRAAPSEAEVFEADRVASVLLSLVGLGESPLTPFLTALGEISRDESSSAAFSEYLAGQPSPDMRLSAIADSLEAVGKATERFEAVLASLRSGTSYREADDTLKALQDAYPTSPYVARLSAFVRHLRWLDTVTATSQALETLFPFAAEEIPSRQAFIDSAKGPVESVSRRPEAMGGRPIPGDAKLYQAALDAYGRYLGARYEADVASSHAMLLARSGNPEKIREALVTAAESASAMTDAASFVSRANFASLLFLTASDYPKATALLGELESIAKNPAKADDGALDAGFPADARDLLLNRALMLRGLGDAVTAEKTLRELDSLTRPSLERGTIPLRLVSVGDSADYLAEKWGRPGVIIYNYYTENWKYPALGASVQIGQTAAGKELRAIRLIRMELGSPVSVGNGLRVGDTRAAFEAIYGKPVYSAGDCDVYLFGGNRLSVLYLANRVRFVTVGL